MSRLGDGEQRAKGRCLVSLPWLPLMCCQIEHIQSWSAFRATVLKTTSEQAQLFKVLNIYIIYSVYLHIYWALLCASWFKKIYRLGLMYIFFSHIYIYLYIYMKVWVLGFLLSCQSSLFTDKAKKKKRKKKTGLGVCKAVTCQCVSHVKYLYFSVACSQKINKVNK